MKYLAQIVLVLISFSTLAQTDVNQSQNQSDLPNFVVLTSKYQQFEPIMLAAQEMNKSFGVFKVVLYGEEVGELSKPEVQKHIKKAQQVGVSLSVCAMALERMQVDPTSIPKEIEIVDNAYLHSLQLQKKGYKSLSL